MYSFFRDKLFRSISFSTHVTSLLTTPMKARLVSAILKVTHLKQYSKLISKLQSTIQHVTNQINE
jgi:hypothetical protein